MAENRCGDCLYFSAEKRVWDDETMSYKASGFHACERILHFDDKPECSNAYVQDGSGYYAALIVKSDFGCVEFKRFHGENIEVIK